MLYRWDHEGEQWRGVALTRGQSLRLNDAAVLRAANGGHYLLLANGASVAVNGLPCLPLRVLADKDEIHVGDEAIYVSIESPAEVVTFAEPEGQVSCGRCKGAMSAGDPAVRCERCGTWHHQGETLSCWMYDTRCSACEQPTAGATWQPEPPGPNRRRA